MDGLETETKEKRAVVVVWVVTRVQARMVVTGHMEVVNVMKMVICRASGMADVS